MTAPQNGSAGADRTRLKSLRTRVLLLTLLVFVAVSIPAYLAFNWIIDTTIIKLGTLFAEKQILFDRYRGMETLSREASLAATLARSPVIKEWARDEDAPDKRVRGLAELEHYRQAFADRSYFFVVDASGNYYFNDRENTYAGDEKRATLDPNNPRDGWYYKTIATSHDCQLNVDHDDNVRVTKVWINCPVVDGSRVLGVIGTGIDLSDFIREVVDIRQVGVNSMFVDHSGAIQAHRDPKMVDFHSLTKDTKSKRTVFSLLDTQSDRDALAALMASALGAANTVQARFVVVGGQRYLAGVGYLDNLGWFNVSLMDIDRIIERQLFAPIAALLAVILIVAALLVTLLFKRIVLDRLARLESSVRSVGAGNYALVNPDKGKDEIGRLSRAFASMAASVSDNTRLLEAMVKERTAKLERLADIDPLTDVFNRRGFIGAVERERNRAVRNGLTLGLMLIDVDFLKNINDAYGHRAGDRVLIEIARRLQRSLRSYDVCARWGGDEFAVLVSDCTARTLSTIADKTLAAVSGEPVKLENAVEAHLTISIGACLVCAGESVDAINAKADSALYAAKDAGRNRIVIYDDAREKKPANIQAD
jgi:diguanylate cyclase (GGDEF)-like protein